MLYLFLFQQLAFTEQWPRKNPKQKYFLQFTLLRISLFCVNSLNRDGQTLHPKWPRAEVKTSRTEQAPRYFKKNILLLARKANNIKIKRMSTSFSSNADIFSTNWNTFLNLKVATTPTGAVTDYELTICRYRRQVAFRACAPVILLHKTLSNIVA